MRAIAVIPARYQSSRLPGKPLLDRSGKTVLEHVFDGCQSAQEIAETWIATDDERIAEAAKGFGARAVMTSPDHPSGTDRVAEVAAEMDADLVVNVQGDEVQLDGLDLDLLVRALRRDTEASFATLATPLTRREDFENPNIVKVVVDGRGRALYFSRASIPSGVGHEMSSGLLQESSPVTPLKHRGIYAFRREELLRFARLEPAPLEKSERLEQLRALHHGLAIQVVTTPRDGIEVNTEEDYRRFLESYGGDA